MRFFPGASVKQQFRFLGIRIILCGAAVIVYLMLWRPARVFIAEQIVHPQLEFFSDQEKNFESELESGALLIRYEFGEGAKQLQYRPQFGFFFLVALMALFFVTDNKKPYLALMLLHLTGTFLVYLSVVVGVFGFQPGFILADALSGYLIPAISLGLVPLVVKGFLEE